MTEVTAPAVADVNKAAAGEAAKDAKELTEATMPEPRTAAQK